MCVDTAKHINSSRLPQITKKAFLMVISELSSINKKITELDNRLAQKEKQDSEVLGLVRTIYDKVIVDKIDERAAQLTLLKKIISSKLSLIALGIAIAGLVAIGISVVYIVENASSVAQIVGSVK